MPLGPIELLVIAFPGTSIRDEIVPPLAELVNSGLIRIMDIAFVRKDSSGSVTSLELDDLDDETFAALDPLVSDVAGRLSDDDIRHPPAPASGGTDLIAQLQLLTQLKDAGALSDAEFEAAKAKLLAG